MDVDQMVQETLNDAMPMSDGQERVELPKLVDNKRVEKSPMQKAIETAFSVDLFRVKSEIKEDAKSLGFSFIGNILHIIVDKFFGSKNVSAKGSSYYGPNVVTSGGVSYTNYAAMSKPQTVDAPSPNRYDFSDLVFPTRQQAVNLKDILERGIAVNGNVTVGEMYDSMDEATVINKNDYHIGWTDLRGTSIVEVGKHRWRLFLPPVKQVR